MRRLTRPAGARSGKRRLAALGAVSLLAVPVLLVPAAPPSAATSSIGGPALSERGLVFGGSSVAPPEISAAAYVVADADTGEVLAAKDPHGLYRPASTLKTLLALTMAPRLDANGTYTADADDTAVEGTRVGMVEHQTYLISQLWYGLWLRSGNDAANGIAKAGADGDVTKAVGMMNLEARRLQALDTTAVNPSGLDADGQLSSAYDLALFGRAALARGDLRTYMKTLKVVFPGDHTRTSTPKNSKSFDVYTGNRLILHGYDGAVGVKNGFTTLARSTFIAAAERDGHTIIATVMRAGSATDDAAALLDWGFAGGGTAVPVGTLVEPASLALVSPDDGSVQSPEPESAVSPGDLPSTDHLGAAGAAGNSTPLGLPGPLLVGLATTAGIAGCVMCVRAAGKRRAG